MRSSILAILEDIANHHKDRIAIKSSSGQLTYGQLWDKSNSLSLFLMEKNKINRKPIMVYGHKNPQMIMCFLACAKAGIPYCPVDISMPKNRIMEIAQTIGNPSILATEDLQLNGFDIITSEMIEDICNANLVREPQFDGTTGDDIYYIIFTSGSTGSPKGVQISADNLMYFVKWSRDLVKENMENSEEAITFMNQAPFSFDLSVMDLYTSLAMGGKLVCLDKQLQSDVGALFEYLKQERINCWVSTPSFAAMCLADKSFCQDNFPDIKLFMFCGERFALETARLLAERFPNATVINTYGPTESTVAVTSVVITPEILGKEDLIPIGLPKPGTTLDIKDEEIIIIGDTVGHGYFNNEEKTQAAFFTIQDEKGNSYRAYKTGDKGYFKDGTYYCSGRMDNQIKLHGYRIELGDIEANLMQCKDVEQAAVLPKYEDGVIKSLVAFVKAPNLDGQFKDVKYIKEQLKEKLPAYMIPKNIKFLDSMPITANGKLDRNKLKEGAL